MSVDPNEEQRMQQDVTLSNHARELELIMYVHGREHSLAAVKLARSAGHGQTIQVWWYSTAIKAHLALSGTEHTWKFLEAAYYQRMDILVTLQESKGLSRNP